MKYGLLPLDSLRKLLADGVQLVPPKQIERRALEDSPHTPLLVAGAATVDAANGGFGKNDGDNEITGVHVSDGDPSTDGILGAKIPQLFQNKKWRWFWTQQHGDNPTYEVVVAPAGG
jgi:hypothetical protein